jgi:biopolymer transport protein ExbD
MKKFSNSYRGHTLSELNITPLLDLVFVLLIIFMIATPVMEQQLAVNLPKSAPQSNTQIPEASIHSVTVDGSGRISLDKTQVSIDELLPALERLKARDGNTTVALRADANLRYQTLVRVLDAIRQAEVKLGLATVPDGG